MRDQQRAKQNAKTRNYDNMLVVWCLASCYKTNFKAKLQKLTTYRDSSLRSTDPRTGCPVFAGEAVACSLWPMPLVLSFIPSANGLPKFKAKHNQKVRQSKTAKLHISRDMSNSSPRFRFSQNFHMSPHQACS